MSPPKSRVIVFEGSGIGSGAGSGIETDSSAGGAEISAVGGTTSFFVDSQEKNEKRIKNARRKKKNLFTFLLYHRKVEVGM